jgi:hypothetical protein
MKRLYRALGATAGGSTGTHGPYTPHCTHSTHCTYSTHCTHSTHCTLLRCSWAVYTSLPTVLYADTHYALYYTQVPTGRTHLILILHTHTVPILHTHIGTRGPYAPNYPLYYTQTLTMHCTLLRYSWAVHTSYCTHTVLVLYSHCILILQVLPTGRTLLTDDGGVIVQLCPSGYHSPTTDH